MKFLKKIKIMIHRFAGRYINWRYCRNAGRNEKEGLKLGLICEEFFHERLRGFGGFGVTLKYITDHFNPNGNTLKAMVCLSTPMDVPRPVVERHHNADVLLRPAAKGSYIRNFLRYGCLLSRQDVNAFLTIEYYPSYEYFLEHVTGIPWLLWIKDPRDEEKWEKILTVDLERKATLKEDSERRQRIVRDRAESLRRMLEVSRKRERRVYVAAETPDFIPIAERLYGVSFPVFSKLPKPMPLRIQGEVPFSGQPSFLFLGRLDPVKRPWVYFELAKRMPEYIFYVAGETHYPEVMGPVIDRYRDVPNLIFLGKVFGEEKDRILKRVWGLINTSVHEGIPCSFVESYSYGKPVIAAVNVDGLTERFGAYTGEILGNADDENSLKRFQETVRKLLSNKEELTAKSRAAREYVAKTHSFEVYERNVQKILSSDANLI